MRFATSTALLAVAVVLIAVIFFHAIRGDIFEAAFQSPLKEWSATVAGHIGSDPIRAQGVARTHKVGIIISNADGRFAFGPDGEPADPDELKVRPDEDGKGIGPYLARRHVPEDFAGQGRSDADPFDKPIDDPAVEAPRPCGHPVEGAHEENFVGFVEVILAKESGSQGRMGFSELRPKLLQIR